MSKYTDPALLDSYDPATTSREHKALENQPRRGSETSDYTDLTLFSRATSMSSQLSDTPVFVALKESPDRPGIGQKTTEYSATSDFSDLELSGTATSTSETTAKSEKAIPFTSSVPSLSALPTKLDVNVRHHQKGSVLQSLPTIRHHTSDQLNPEGDEYIPREYDHAGEAKIDGDGYLQGGREYKLRTFTLSGRAEKLFMLATECARTLQYRDSYLLFNKNRSLFKIIAQPKEKEELVARDLLPYSYRSRQIALVTARSIFRQFESRVIKDGRRVRDDYWEAKARKQGFTEEDAAGEKRPGAARAREAVLEVARSGRQLNAWGDLLYSNIVSSSAFSTPLPPRLTTGPDDVEYRDIAQSQRQALTVSPYQDMTRLNTNVEVAGQASHVADYSKSINAQSRYRRNTVEEYWRRPHDPIFPIEKAEARANDSPQTGSLGHAMEFPQVRFDVTENLDTTRFLEDGRPEGGERLPRFFKYPSSVIMPQESHTVAHQIHTTGSDSPVSGLENTKDAERNSLLVAVYSFYALCRQTIELAVGASGQQLAFDSGSSDTLVIPQDDTTSSNSSANNLSNKRKANDIGDHEGQDGNDSEASTARKKGKHKKIVTTEFPCWWYVNDPVRHQACRNYCSRKRDLHSYRRHHFEDHWRWGDVEADGVSFERWNAAKHATCDLPGLTADERAHRKWERSYQIYFDLKETDQMPEPVCPVIRHIHYRPKRPIRCELPANRHQSSPITEPGPSNAQVAPVTANISSDLIPNNSFLEVPTQPISIPHLFPETSLENYGDPFHPEYFASWNDHFNVASDLIHTTPSVETPRLILIDHVSRIRLMLESMYNDPRRISRDSIATVLLLARDFELDFMQATIDNNHLISLAGSAALSRSYNNPMPMQAGNNNTPTTALSYTISGRDAHQQSLEDQSDGQTSGSETLNAPETPSPADDGHVWTMSNIVDERGVTEAVNADTPQASKPLNPGKNLNLFQAIGNSGMQPDDPVVNYLWGTRRA